VGCGEVGGVVNLFKISIYYNNKTNAMKTKLLLSVMAMLSIGLPAQEYHLLIEEGNSWSVLYESSGPPPATTYTYAISGDTLINQIEYKKLYMSSQQEPNEWKLDWAVREEDDRKVYVWSFHLMEEWLMYDFAAAVGDTFTILPADPNLYLVIDSITITEINGSERSKFWLTIMENGTPSPFMDEPETWIEGIGSNKGIVHSGSSAFIGAAHWLTCKWENEELVYLNPDYDSCYITTVSVKEMGVSRFQLFPNPTTAQAWLQLPENTPLAQVQIELFNTTGRLLHKVQPTGQFHKIDVAHLPKGLYLVRVWDGERWRAEKLVVR
jgi:hypothetical protein